MHYEHVGPSLCGPRHDAAGGDDGWVGGGRRRIGVGDGGPAFGGQEVLHPLGVQDIHLTAEDGEVEASAHGTDILGQGPPCHQGAGRIGLPHGDDGLS